MLKLLVLSLQVIIFGNGILCTGFLWGDMYCKCNWSLSLFNVHRYPTLPFSPQELLHDLSGELRMEVEHGLRERLTGTWKLSDRWSLSDRDRHVPSDNEGEGKRGRVKWEGWGGTDEVERERREIEKREGGFPNLNSPQTSLVLN